MKVSLLTFYFIVSKDLSRLCCGQPKKSVFFSGNNLEKIKHTEIAKWLREQRYCSINFVHIIKKEGNG